MVVVTGLNQLSKEMSSNTTMAAVVFKFNSILLGLKC